jgi:hypothetical protein
MIVRTLLMAVTVSGVMLAQESSPNTSTTQPAQTSGPESPEWQALSVKEKLSYDWRHLFDVDNVVYAGIGASFDQLRDRPGACGEGWAHLGSVMPRI